MFGFKLSISEQCFFFKRLAFLVAAGVPLLEALHMLREQASGKAQAALLAQVCVEVSEGQPLSRSLAKRGSFSAFSVSIVAIGEQSGALAANLRYLADELHKTQQLKRALVGAAIYPALITVATFGITAFLLLFLFPKILPIFKSMHVALPLSTRMVMYASSALEHWGVLLVLVVAVVVAALAVALQKSARLHVLFDRALLRVPLIGPVLQAYNASHISRTLGLLLTSGVALSSAVRITADATHNALYRQELLLLGGAVERGERMSAYVAKRAYFPPTMRHLVAVGERSGSLSETLMYLAESYDAEVAEFTKRLATLIEPALMLVMGLLVGFIAISIITPLYGITQGLHG